MKIIIVICGLVFCVSGCVHTDSGMMERRNGNDRTAAAHAVAEAPHKRAEDLERRGKHKEAMELYAMIQASSKQSGEVDAARIGRARCMLRMNKPDAAIALLSDLPEEPVTVRDSEQMALVGEAFLRKGHSVPAESLFEVALSLPDVEQQSWAPPAYANLATAYLRNNKPDRAYQVYEFAANLFRRKAQYSESSDCRQMARMLRQDESASPARETTRSIQMKTGI